MVKSSPTQTVGDVAITVDKDPEDGRVIIKIILMPGTPKHRARNVIEPAASRALQKFCGKVRKRPPGISMIRFDQDEIAQEGGAPINLAVDELGIDEACDTLAIEFGSDYVRTRGLDIDGTLKRYTTLINQEL